MTGPFGILNREELNPYLQFHFEKKFHLKTVWDQFVVIAASFHGKICRGIPIWTSAGGNRGRPRKKTAAPVRRENRRRRISTRFPPRVVALRIIIDVILGVPGLPIKL
jgi:hypothetical protein